MSKPTLVSIRQSILKRRIDPAVKEYLEATFTAKNYYIEHYTAQIDPQTDKIYKRSQSSKGEFIEVYRTLFGHTFYYSLRDPKWNGFAASNDTIDNYLEIQSCFHPNPIYLSFDDYLTPLAMFDNLLEILPRQSMLERGLTGHDLLILVPVLKYWRGKTVSRQKLFHSLQKYEKGVEDIIQELMVGCCFIEWLKVHVTGDDIL